MRILLLIISVTITHHVCFAQHEDQIWLFGTSSVNVADIQGYAYGAQGLGKGFTANADHCLFANASIETTFGAKEKIKCRVPVMTGALGSTFIAANYWPSFAVGSALCGFPIVVGESVKHHVPRT